MRQYLIWEVVSYAWTEIGLLDEEIEKYAVSASELYDDWDEVKRIIYNDVCFSFAFDSFLVLPCMLWVLMPDWGYDEEYLRKRAESWYEKPTWKRFVNPIRVIGYPISIFMAYSLIRKFKKAYFKRKLG